MAPSKNRKIGLSMKIGLMPFHERIEVGRVAVSDGDFQSRHPEIVDIFPLLAEHNAGINITINNAITLRFFIGFFISISSGSFPAGLPVPCS